MSEKSDLTTSMSGPDKEELHKIGQSARESEITANLPANISKTESGNILQQADFNPVISTIQPEKKPIWERSSYKLFKELIWWYILLRPAASIFKGFLPNWLLAIMHIH